MVARFEHWITLDNIGLCCVFVRTADYQLGHAPLLQSLLEVRVTKSIYKDVEIFFYEDNIIKK
jgi:hypothetical protein